MMLNGSTEYNDYDSNTLLEINALLKERIAKLGDSKVKQAEYYENLVDNIMLENINQEKRLELQRLNIEELKDKEQNYKLTIRIKDGEIRDLRNMITNKESDIEDIKKNMQKDRRSAILSFGEQEAQLKNQLLDKVNKIEILLKENEKIKIEKDELIKETIDLKRKTAKSFLFFKNNSKRKEQRGKGSRLTSLEKNKENISKDIKRRRNKMSTIFNFESNKKMRECSFFVNDSPKPLEMECDDFINSKNNLSLSQLCSPFCKKEKSQIHITDEKANAYKITNVSDCEEELNRSQNSSHTFLNLTRNVFSMENNTEERIMTNLSFRELKEKSIKGSKKDKEEVVLNNPLDVIFKENDSHYTLGEEDIDCFNKKLIIERRICFNGVYDEMSESVVKNFKIKRRLRKNKAGVVLFKICTFPAKATLSILTRIVRSLNCFNC